MAPATTASSCLFSFLQHMQQTMQQMMGMHTTTMIEMTITQVYQACQMPRLEYSTQLMVKPVVESELPEAIEVDTMLVPEQSPEL